MSILAEYEQTRRRLGEEKYRHIENFLQCHKHYYLSDVYYRQSVFTEFEAWEKVTYTGITEI